jgi:hypothetical protein
LSVATSAKEAAVTDIRQYFGSIRGEWAAHCGFLLLVFCLLLCLPGAAYAQVSETFTNADGNSFWSDGNNWSPPTAPGGPNGNFNVTVDPGTAPILDVPASIVNLTIYALAALWVTNKNQLTITGASIENDGQLSIAPLTGFSNNAGALIIDNTVTLFGSGSTYMNSNSSNGDPNPIYGYGKGTLINQQLLSGSGIITGVTVQNQGPNGQIRGGTPANPLTFSHVQMTNTGLISGLGNTTIDFYLSTVQNAGGTIDATDSGQVLLDTSTIIGGTIGSASAHISFFAPTLNGVTITGTYSVTSTASAYMDTLLEGTITNNGQIVVTSPPGYQKATLYVSGSVTLQGTGQVSMSGSNAWLTGKGGTATVTNVAPHVISGGNITDFTEVINQSELLNQMLMEVTEVQNFTPATIEDVQTINGGIVEGGSIEDAEGGTTVEGGATISNATITGQGVITVVSGTLNADTIETVVQVNDSDKCTLKGTEVINSPGEIFLDASQGTATLVDSGAVTLSGTGQVVTSTSPGNVIVGAAGTNSLTIDVLTVNFEGTIGDGKTMNVTIGAPATVTNGGYPLIFNIGSNHTLNNLGTLVEGDSTTEILGNFKNYNSATNTLTGGSYLLSGTLQFNNANIVTNSADVTFTGTGGRIVDQNGNNGLLNLSTTTLKGTFSLSGQDVFQTAGTYSNGGKSIILAGSYLTVGGTSTNYNQSGTTAVTTVDGKIIVPAGGVTNITGGTLQGAGSFNGDVSIGNAAGGTAATFIVGDSKKSSALVTIENNYTQLATGITDVQIGGTNVGTQYSQLSVTGPVTLGGTLNVALINKFKPVSGDQFTIINAPSGVTGTFTTVKLPTNFQVVYNPTSVELNVQ